MLAVDVKVMIFANHLGQSHDGLVVEFLHLAAAAAAEVTVTVLRVVKRIVNLVVTAGHPIDEAHLMKAFQGAVHRGQIQPRQTRLGHLEKIFGREVLMAFDFAKKLEQGRALGGDAKTVIAQKFEIIGHSRSGSSRGHRFPPALSLGVPA